MSGTESGPAGSRPKLHQAFTLIEVLVVVLVLLLFAGLAWAFVGSARHVHHHLTCSQNLKEIGLAVPDFARDHGNRVGWQISTNEGGSLEYGLSGAQTFRHFQVQSHYINACIILLCPQDNRDAAANWGSLSNANVSYFVGLDSDPKLPLSIVAGDRNITAASGVILQWNPSSPPGWVKSVGLHGDKGHVAFGDGHVEELDSAGLSNALQRAGMSTNRFAVP
jgi:prepilin-type N-terminal cleavage/methylation domain-containing protein/prepilin-type processing-associated H-X9-DG protein